MSDRYDPAAFEAKWRKRWKSANLFATREEEGRPKFYGLDFFPYPSGAGLSVGHCRNYIPTDVLCRMRYMQGYNVLHPMGFDAFGLPAENEAIKNKTHPAPMIDRYAETYHRQMDLVGISYDWSRSFKSCDPDYYRWTQWIFELLYRRGLAYRKPAAVNWDPVDKTVLADEEVIAGRAERSGALVEKRYIQQWFFKITEYAQRLIDDLDTIDWPDGIKSQQRNWIGRSEGVRFRIKVKGSEKHDETAEDGFVVHGQGKELSFEVFTTRIDTIFGMTFCVLAPEHPLVKDLLKIIPPDRQAAVQAYVEQAGSLSDADRTSATREKTGVETGAFAINPANGNTVPIFVADYVLATYGTGAIMAVPGHDERDFEFARRFGVPVIPVIQPAGPAGWSDAARKAWERLAASGADTLSPSGRAMAKAAIPLALRTHTESRPKLPPSTRASLERLRAALHSDVDAVVISSEIAEGVDHEILMLPPGLAQVIGEDAQLRTEFVASLAGRYRASFGLPASVATAIEECVRHAVMSAIGLLRDRVPELYFGIYTGQEGRLVNSGEYTGMSCAQAMRELSEWIEALGIGERQVQYRLRDWLISRQRYWGCPIPVVHSADGEEQLVHESDLPVLLPDVENYEPGNDGASPLAGIPDFVNVTDNDGRLGHRETDTMGGFACSSWYFLRFCDPHDGEKAWDPKLVDYWMPVDCYVGGAEHAVMHLLYARFWTKVLYDAGLVQVKEPFSRLENQGQVLAQTPYRKPKPGEKLALGEEGIQITTAQAKSLPQDEVFWRWARMSKSKGNVVTPEEAVKAHGADALRVYELFVAPFNQDVQWSTDGLVGASRFLSRVFKLVADTAQLYDPDWKRQIEFVELDAASVRIRRWTHQTIRKATTDIERFAFNTYIAQLMKFVNALNDEWKVTPKPSQSFAVAMSEAVESLILVLSPAAPHSSDELWNQLGREGFTYCADWPHFRAELAEEDMVNVAIQVNGKLRDTVQLAKGLDSKELEGIALALPKVKAHLEGKSVRKAIVVPDRLVNIVAG